MNGWKLRQGRRIEFLEATLTQKRNPLMTLVTKSDSKIQATKVHSDFSRRVVACQLAMPSRACLYSTTTSNQSFCSR